MKEKFSPALIDRMESPERRVELPADMLLEALGIQKGMTVLDMGAGTGYFSFPAAALTSGEVIAADVQPEMIAFMQEKAAEQSISNVHPLLAAAEQLPLRDGSIDRAIVSLVLHATDTVEEPVKELARVLRPGGRVLILEWMKKLDETRVPPPSRIEPEEMKEVLTRFGFSTVLLDYPTERIYRIIAELTA